MTAEPVAGEEGAAAEEEKVSMNRKEKRKAAKKQKRKQTRREAAAKAREEEEARMNDPEELARLRLMEEEEAQRAERERMEFEERERLWIETMEVKMMKKAAAAAAEEEERKVLKEAERAKDKDEIESDEDGKWEYVEEGPAEIIWQGNEIIVKKKRVKVPRKDLEQESGKQDTKRPTSNPLPPQSEAFGDYKNASVVSTQQVFDNVAQQIPNFGTEQDKDHCPFHFKTGACRFGQRCSRVHFYPDRSCTLLIKNMYNGPGLTWEQDEGLEVCKWCQRAILYTEEEVERCYEEFYEDVHTEFLKFGEIVNFKVCRNGSIHLRGNVYVHYKSLDSAVLAYNSINARYFAGKQVSCEFVGVTRWKVAICGEFMKSRMKTCSRGTACNFIHCFRNPGGDYEWADWDKAAPKFWVKKMVALFGFSDAYDREPEQDRLDQLGNSNRTMAADTDRKLSRRSRSRDYSNHSDFRRFRDENHFWKSLDRSRSDGRMQKGHEKANHLHYEFDDNKDGHHNYTRKSSNLSDDEHCIHEFDFSKDQLEKDERRGKQDTRHSSRSRDRSQETYSCRGDGDGDRDRDSGSSRKHLKWNDGKSDDLNDQHKNKKREVSRKIYSFRGHRDRNGGSSTKRSKWCDEKLYDPDDNWDKNKIDESDSDWSDGDRYHGHVRKSSRYQEKESGYSDGHCDEKNRGPDSTDADRADRDWGDKQKHRRSRKRSRNRY